MDMQHQGFKLVASGEIFHWIHPAMLTSDDINCTNMTDDEFEAQVVRSVGIFKFCSAPEMHKAKS